MTALSEDPISTLEQLANLIDEVGNEPKKMSSRWPGISDLTGCCVTYMGHTQCSKRPVGAIVLRCPTCEETLPEIGKCATHLDKAIDAMSYCVTCKKRGLDSFLLPVSCRWFR